MASQELLDYLNTELTECDNKIAEQEAMKINLDQAIAQYQQTILQLKDQKTQCDVVIDSYEQEKIYVNQLITIVQNEPSK